MILLALIAHFIVNMFILLFFSLGGDLDAEEGLALFFFGWILIVWSYITDGWKSFKSWKEYHAWSILWVLISLAAIGGIIAIYFKHAG
tara:strand:- start:24865 stop:25128 length:264 start_codon:yes stop_codon:yes gene_type:complete